MVDFQMKLMEPVISELLYLTLELAQMLNLQQALFGYYKLTSHPSVQYCKSIKVCGPFQILWDNYVMAYNDPTVMMQVWYPAIKVVILTVDYLTIAILFGSYLIVFLSAYIIKWIGLLVLQDEEFYKEQV